LSFCFIAQSVGGKINMRGRCISAGMLATRENRRFSWPRKTRWFFSGIKDFALFFNYFPT